MKSTTLKEFLSQGWNKSKFVIWKANMICNQKPLYMPNLSNLSTVLKLKNNRLKSMSPSVARTEIEFTIKTPSPKLQSKNIKNLSINLNYSKS